MPLTVHPLHTMTTEEAKGLASVLNSGGLLQIADWCDHASVTLRDRIKEAREQGLRDDASALIADVSRFALLAAACRCIINTNEGN